MTMLKAFSIVISTAVLATACSSTPHTNSGALQDQAAKTNETSGNATTQSVMSKNATATTGTTITTGAAARNGMNGAHHSSANSIEHSVYFDYDSYVLKSESTPVVTANAEYVKANKITKIIVQGNTDERGGSEYNLALGQKRADAVRKSLLLLGIPNNQIEAISFGKEKPKAKGSHEAAWAENRRVDMVTEK